LRQICSCWRRGWLTEALDTSQELRLGVLGERRRLKISIASRTRAALVGACHGGAGTLRRMRFGVAAGARCALRACRHARADRVHEQRASLSAESGGFHADAPERRSACRTRLARDRPEQMHAAGLRSVLRGQLTRSLQRQLDTIVPFVVNLAERAQQPDLGEALLRQELCALPVLLIERQQDVRGRRLLTPLARHFRSARDDA
jgi:hypothetical protein